MLKILRGYADLLIGLGLLGLVILVIVLVQPDRPSDPASVYTAPEPSTVTLTPGAEGATVTEAEAPPEPEYGTLEGQVRDAAGRPVEGVRVLAASEPFTPVEMRMVTMPAGPTQVTTSDAEGRYRFEKLPVGNHRLRLGTKGSPWAMAWHPLAAHVSGGESVLVRKDTSTVLDTEVLRSASIRGAVEAPAGQTFSVELQQRVTPTEEQPSEWIAVRTVSSGRDYRFDLLPPGDYRVVVDASGTGIVYAPAATSPRRADVVTLTPGERVTGVDVTVPAPGVVTGRVTTSTGAPVTNHQIILHTGWRSTDPRFPAAPTTTVTARTDAAGRYRQELPHGTWTIQVDSCTFSSSELKVRSVVGRTRTQDLTTDATASLSGRVTNPSGRPVSEVNVSVEVPNGECAVAALTDAAGEWTVKGVTPGAARIEYGVYTESTFTKYFHPGSLELDDLERVRVGLGAKLTGVDAVLE